MIRSTPKNALRWALERGDPVFGAAVTTFSPTMIEVYGDLRLDYAWLDLEHGGPSPYDSVALERLTRTADAADIELLVRLPSGDPELVRKVLDSGVKTILVPRIETADEVERAVAAAHFEYDGGGDDGTVGDRGVGVARASRWGSDMADYVADAAETVLVGAMIENERAVENVHGILSVPNLGFVFVGPSDLSVSLRHPLQKDHPDVRASIEETREAALEADVPIGCIRNDPAAANDAVDAGYRILRIGGDVSAAREVLTARLGALDR